MRRAIVVYGDRRTGRAISEGMESADLKRAREEIDFWRMSAASYKELYAHKSAECRKANMEKSFAKIRRYQIRHAVFAPYYWMTDRIAILLYVICILINQGVEGQPKWQS